MTSATLVPDLLNEYGALARTNLFRYLPNREPKRYLYDLLSDYPKRGGRGFRPSLCMATTRAFGRPIEDALNTAAAVELMHNAMLIHDDIEDESEQRRGLPTLHMKHGIAMALNAGDLLLLSSLQPLLDNRERLGPTLSLAVIEETQRMGRESAEGQALELGWRFDNPDNIAEDDYLRMVLKKTCWLTTIHPMRTGAMIGSEGMADLEPILRFGFLLGAAFQIQDDLLNLVGNAVVYGKELAGDIYEGKRTLMLIRLFALATPEEKHRLRELLGKPRADRTFEAVAWVRARMDHYECIPYAQRMASSLAGAAEAEYDNIFRDLPPTRDKDFIAALPKWVIERT
jgi:geranylgeranyl diphosphate synthase type II